MKKVTTVELAALALRFAESVVATSCIPSHTLATPLRGFTGSTFAVLSHIQGSTLLAVISERVVRDFRLRPNDLLSRACEQRITFVRQLAMFLCRKMMGTPFQSIGEHSNRDHSTVIHACRLIERRIRGDAAFGLFIAKLKGRITKTVSITAAAAV